MPPTKTRINIMLDNDVLAHFRSVAEQTGRGYQTLINESLRSVSQIEGALGHAPLDKNMVKMVEETSRQVRALESQLEAAGVSSIVKQAEAHRDALAASLKGVQDLVSVPSKQLQDAMDSLSIGKTAEKALKSMYAPLDELMASVQGPLDAFRAVDMHLKRTLGNSTLMRRLPSRASKLRPR